MARPLWAGSLSFGLVNVPVALFTAVRDQDLHFHELHEKDGARIEQKRFCAEEDAEVPFEEIGHAYDLENGKTVIVTDEELQEVAPRRTRTIDIEAFVARDEIDPMLFDHPYFLAPTGDADGPRRAYRLLLEVMEESGKVALGRFVMRTKEYLVTIGPRDDRLALTTMRFADEIRDTKGIDGGGKKPAKKELDQAVSLIEALSADWDPSDWKDEFRARLEDVIQRKRKGRTIEAPEERDEPEPVPDLMAALEESLANAKRGGKKSGKGKRGGRAQGAQLAEPQPGGEARVAEPGQRGDRVARGLEHEDAVGRPAAERGLAAGAPAASSAAGACARSQARDGGPGQRGAGDAREPHVPGQQAAGVGAGRERGGEAGGEQPLCARGPPAARARRRARRARRRAARRPAPPARRASPPPPDSP